MAACGPATKYVSAPEKRPIWIPKELNRAAAPVQSEPQAPVCGATSIRMKKRPKATVEATASRSPAGHRHGRVGGVANDRCRLQGGEDDTDDDGHDARRGQWRQLFTRRDRVDDRENDRASGDRRHKRDRADRHGPIEQCQTDAGAQSAQQRPRNLTLGEGWPQQKRARRPRSPAEQLGPEADLRGGMRREAKPAAKSPMPMQTAPPSPRRIGST